ncbi:MAG TPA: hypothetical protein VGH87_16095 [Polyangiaceae bacterium]|jgi:Spy/CpxP family protein refolding chaperone|nr:hypothetical protein [Polyangiaceae bacterium]
MVTSKAAAYLLIACVFLLGVVAGGAAVMAWTSDQRAAVLRDGPPAQKHKAHVLSRKLDLDPDQEQRVATILTSDVDESREILRDHRAHVDDEIRTVLRPEQRRRFEHIVEQRPPHRRR